ncbi:MAG: glycosyl hydrolase [Marmoricola sp.]|nr:glycosyl hydrolase [Marmoricola sp.]
MTQQPDTRTHKAWHDETRPLAERVELLLAAMTLEEKVGQLGSRWMGNNLAGEAGVEGSDLQVAPMQDVFTASGTVPLAEASRHGLGHLTRIYGSRPVTVTEGAAELVEQQRVVVDSSRFGIPALVHEECLTGFTAYGATVFPAAIAWGATWDPDLVRRMAAAIGHDMAALGVHQGLSPVLDVVRDYRWGRVEETIGEDPHLVAMLGTAYVQGLQSAGVIATLKHFAGYSASRAARNHGPVSMGTRELRDVILPPFETAVALGGAGSVMNSYADVDGVPAGANTWLLTDVLRQEWGFEGTVVSDYWAVPFLASMHRVAPGHAEAGALALEAGIDVELPDTLGYGEGLVELVRSGVLDEALVDRAARRALLAKAQLGLLDAGWTPESSVARAAGVHLDSPANRELAREVAERSVILLDAGTALPIRDAQRPLPRKVAVVGPCADNALTFMGCYAFPTHVLPRHPRSDLGIEVPTALDALRAELGEVEVVHETGCEVMGEDRGGFAAAVAAARDAELCVAYVGDLAGLFGHGSSGEGCDAEDLRLPGVQADLVEELLATGTPVVLVVVSGRPYALGAFDGRVAGLVQSFFPGEEGGTAIAGVLSGRLCPGGRLPVQVPRRVGGQPSTYLQPPLGGVESAGITSVDSTPLYPFGYGASYTTFSLDDVRASAEEITTDGAVEVSVVVTNTGDRAGDEVVQVYLHDPVARVARPVRQLVGFARVRLEPGRSAELVFDLHADRTAYTDASLDRIVEAGVVHFLVGTSAADERARVPVRLTGATRVVGHDRRLDTPTRVEHRATP